MCRTGSILSRDPTQFGFKGGIGRPLKRHLNHILLKLSREPKIFYDGMSSSVGSPSQTSEYWGNH